MGLWSSSGRELLPLGHSLRDVLILWNGNSWQWRFARIAVCSFSVRNFWNFENWNFENSTGSMVIGNVKLDNSAQRTPSL